MSFEVGETIVCSIEVKNSAGTKVDPATSMTITIYDPDGVVDINAVGMTPDVVGEYYYDYQTSGKATGKYAVKYIATDGSRISSKLDSFRLV